MNYICQYQTRDIEWLTHKVKYPRIHEFLFEIGYTWIQHSPLTMWVPVHHVVGGWGGGIFTVLVYTDFQWMWIVTWSHLCCTWPGVSPWALGAFSTLYLAIHTPCEEWTRRRARRTAVAGYNTQGRHQLMTQHVLKSSTLSECFLMCWVVIWSNLGSEAPPGIRPVGCEVKNTSH